MITPRWDTTRTQPIAVGDVVRYLLGVLTRPEAAGRIHRPALIDWMTNEVIVRDHSIRDLIPFDPMPDDAVRKALGERARAKRDGR